MGPPYLMRSASDDIVTGCVPSHSSEKRFTETKAVRIWEKVRSICRKDIMQLTTLATGDKMESVKSNAIVYNTRSHVGNEDLRIIVIMLPAREFVA